VNVQVLSELDPAQLTELGELLVRCESADGHPALAEPQRDAAAQPDLGGWGARALLASAGGALLGCAILSPTADGTTSLHLAIDPTRRGRDGGDDVWTTLASAAMREASGNTRLWIMQAADADDEQAARLGFQPERDLLQMRVALPLPTATVSGGQTVTTRPFVPGQDDEVWLSLNNRAFVGHPEQGNWSLEKLRARLGAGWFDPNGLLMADDPDGGGLIGSCWTKIHRQNQPLLGEIYIIAVDPSRHGEGWGRALTVAGLEWLAQQGVTVGMLYTDASNTAAVALYRSLGFTVDHVDRSYLHSGEERSAPSRSADAAADGAPDAVGHAGGDGGDTELAQR
jgi:mycothiol synthase